MASKEYSIVSRRETEADGVENDLSTECVPGHRHWSRILVLLSIALALSTLLNLLLLTRWALPAKRDDPLVSRFARLAYDVPTEIKRNSTYSDPDRAVEDAAWSAQTIQPQNGFIALDDEYTEAMGLWHSQRSPWFKDKGVYILTSSHEIHCVHVLRQTVNQVHDKLTLTWSHRHLMHCLDLLRESIMCNADDSPLYTGPLHVQTNLAHPHAGIGTIKMCRDWDKLQAWARAHSACYNPYKMNDPTISELERYKYCPDGSRPWEEMGGEQLDLFS